MKSITRLLAIFIFIVLASFVVACNTTTPANKPSGPSSTTPSTGQTPDGGSSNGDSGSNIDPNPDSKPDSVPQYEDSRVAVLDKNSPEASIIVYASDLDDEAEHLQSVLTAVGIAGIDKTDSASQDAEYRIIIGNIECAATDAAKELYFKAKSDDDFVWAFAYVDGDLAIYAEGDIAYEQAISDLVSKNANLGKLIIEKDFSATGVYTKAQYQALLNQIAKEEQTTAQHEALIDSILALLETQRAELKTYTGKVSKYDENDPEILLFQQYRAHLGYPTSGRPTVTPTEDHPRLLITSDMIPEIQKSLRSGDAKARQFQTLITRLSQMAVYSGPLIPQASPRTSITPTSRSFRRRLSLMPYTAMLTMAIKQYIT